MAIYDCFLFLDELDFSQIPTAGTEGRRRRQYRIHLRNPGSRTTHVHASSYERCADFVHKFLQPHEPLEVADVGSFDVNGTYRELFSQTEWKYCGFDVAAGPNVDAVLSSPEDWRLDPRHIEAYDVVISGQVLEHVRRPWHWIHQVASLCRRGGLIWICAPNTWVYHEHPIDCWRVFPEGLKALYEDAGIEMIECGFIGPDTVEIGRKTSSASDESSVSPA